MADETPLESGQTGEQDLPTPEFSETGGSSTSSGADEIVSKLITQLEPLIDRKVQSVKDKRLSKIEKALGGRLGLLAELEEHGVSIPQEVRTEMQIRELQERIDGQQTAQPAPASVDGSTQRKAAVTEAIAELNRHGLDPNDASFIELLRGRYTNRTEFDLAVTRYVVAKLAPPKPANPAEVVQPPVRTGASAEKSPDQLRQQYTQEAMQIAQTMKGDQKLRALADLKTRYRGQGLDI